MNGKLLSALAMAGITAASIGTAALAEKGGPDGEAMLQKFEQLDADKDGKVTPDEIEAAKAARFAAADTDKNGLLSAEELTAMHILKMQERMGERSAKMIEKLDADGDGQLSAEELAKMGKRKSPFEKADADGDGAVSLEEAKAAMEDHGPGKKHGKHDKHGKRGDRGHGGPDGGLWWE